MYSEIIELSKKLTNALESLDVMTSDINGCELNSNVQLFILGQELEEAITAHIETYGEIAKKEGVLPNELRIYEERGWFE